MTDPEMEEIYESLATKIDALGKEKSDIFLAKLTLLSIKKIHRFRRNYEMHRRGFVRFRKLNP
jgi:hypothetical protein